MEDGNGEPLRWGGPGSAQSKLRGVPEPFGGASRGPRAVRRGETGSPASRCGGARRIPRAATRLLRLAPSDRLLPPFFSPASPGGRPLPPEGAFFVRDYGNCSHFCAIFPCSRTRILTQNPPFFRNLAPCFFVISRPPARPGVCARKTAQPPATSNCRDGTLAVVAGYGNGSDAPRREARAPAFHHEVRDYGERKARRRGRRRGIPSPAKRGATPSDCSLYNLSDAPPDGARFSGGSGNRRPRTGFANVWQNRTHFAKHWQHAFARGGCRASTPRPSRSGIRGP